MVRHVAYNETRACRSPHTRGDGPLRRILLLRTPGFSPHAWGWSESWVSCCYPLSVLPTRVGMVRGTSWWSSGLVSSPHTRGDGPGTVPSDIAASQFSPHAWGWSVLTKPLRDRLHVLPTRVGMVRMVSTSSKGASSSPHTRGDGPPWSERLHGWAGFSPHAWGWSGLSLRHMSTWYVLPTRVGMVRATAIPRPVGRRSPHTRGDGPASPLKKGMMDVFSPHAWGWSDSVTFEADYASVLPTRVGMVRAG